MKILRITVIYLWVMINFTTVSPQRHKTWADVWKKIGDMFTFYSRVFLRNEGVLTDFEDCGVRQEIPLRSGEVLFKADCWRDCPWIDTETIFRYRILSRTISFTFNGNSLQGTRALVFTSPRRPADWNCFFDACYSDYKNFVDVSFNQNSGNACTNRGFTFTNADFDTNLQNIVDCSLLGYSQQGFHYDKDIYSMMTSYSYIYLNTAPGTYTGTFSHKRKKRSKPNHNENKWNINPKNSSIEAIVVETEKINLQEVDKEAVQFLPDRIIFYPEKLKCEQGTNDQLRFNESFTRLIGPSVDKVESNPLASDIRKYPWSCSLRSRNFRSFHKCGVTLLSGPPKPTVLVSAAHCNYICKDGKGRILESCCCSSVGDDDYVLNCRASHHCTADAKSYLADPEDMVIICGEESSQSESFFFSPEKETILPIKEIINYPLFDPENMINGHDIAVYLVDDTNLKNSEFFNKNNIWPACLPKPRYEYVQQNGKQTTGFSTGWDIGDSYDRFIDTDTFLSEDLQDKYGHKEALMENVDCLDIEYNGGKTNTYYPPKSVCFRDPTYNSCPNFGASGSGILRPFKSSSFTRYSFQGPMSFHRGCIQIPITTTNSAGTRTQFIFRQSFNPTVYLDAICYIRWIALVYGMTLPYGFREPDYCASNQGTGDINDREKEDCLTAMPHVPREKCDWSMTKKKLFLDRCSRTSTEEVEALRFQCATASGDVQHCSNNCIGVTETAIIVGGGLIVSSAALSGTSLIAPFTIAASAFLGNMYMNREVAPCPDVCRLRAGGCIKGRRCSILIQAVIDDTK